MNPDPVVVHELDKQTYNPDMATAIEVIETLSVAMEQTFERYTRQQQAKRPDLYRLTMSGLGVCTRQSAYRISRTSPSDPALAWTGQRRAAHLGTWIHDGLLPQLAEELGTHTELDLVLNGAGLTIPGRTDLYWPRAGVIADLKTTSRDPEAFAATTGPLRSHWFQLIGYATAAAQQGHLVRWMAWIYLHRDSGKTWPIVQPYTTDIATQAENHLTHLAIHSAIPDDAPRGQPGPGRSYVCDSCPWLTRCWDKP